MDKIKHIYRLRYAWKQLLAAAMAILAFSGIAMYVSADTSVTFKISAYSGESQPFYLFTSNEIKKPVAITNVSGRDSNIDGADTVITEATALTYIRWSVDEQNAIDSSSKDIFMYENSEGDLKKEIAFLDDYPTYSPTANPDLSKEYIKNPKVKAVHAGRAKLVASYYTRKSSTSGGGASYVDELHRKEEVYAYVRLSVDARVNGSVIANNKIYKVGDTITIKTNTSAANPAVLNISDENEVLKLKSSDPANGIYEIEIVGGGVSGFTIKTRDCDDDQSSNAITEANGLYLSKRFVVNSAIEFASDSDIATKSEFKEFRENATVINSSAVSSVTARKIISLKPSGVGKEIIVPSNVINPKNLKGITYTATRPEIAEFSGGYITGKTAGITPIAAEILMENAGGGYTAVSRYEADVIVPFASYIPTDITMNVGDRIVIKTTGLDQYVNLTSDKSSVITQYQSPMAVYGEFQALSAGTATITATLDLPEELDGDEELIKKIYGSDSLTIKYNINVIDTFGINKDKVSVPVNKSVTVRALVSKGDFEKYGVNFVVENIEDSDGIVPSEQLISVEQIGSEFTANMQSYGYVEYRINGISPGKAKLTLYQTIDGVMKSASCIVTVTQPVGSIRFDKPSITIYKGAVEEVNIVFDPIPDNTAVLWRSANEDIATVTPRAEDSRRAEIKGISGGTTAINVISLDNFDVIATLEVNVKVPLEGLHIPASLTLDFAMGQYQIIPEIFPLGVEGVNRKVTWYSSDDSIATVSNEVATNGIVTFVKPGTVAITCMTDDDGPNGVKLTATCVINISIPVESIRLNKTQEILKVGDSAQLEAYLSPSEATYTAVTWETSDPNVCTVDDTGKIVAIGTGRCTILCKAKDPSSTATAMCNVFVQQPVTSVVLNTKEITVRKGQVFWLNANCLPADADDKSVTWSSNDTSVCTVAEDGMVTAVGAGTTFIVVQSNDSGVSDTCKVIVTQPVTGIIFKTGNSITLTVNPVDDETEHQSFLIIPEVLPMDAENKNVKYTSSDPEVATVEPMNVGGVAGGYVTAVKAGTCQIIATTEECELTAICRVTVKEYVQSVTLDQHEMFLNIDSKDGKVLKATIERPSATNMGLVWSSSDTSICTVNENGKVIGHKVGTAVITATAADGSGASDSCVVTVVNPVTKITVVPDVVHLLVGESKIVSAVIEPAGATIKDVDWSSSNEEIAMVDEAGEIFALSTGKCKITATSKDGNEIKGSCWVYVNPVVDIDSINLNSTDIYMLAGKSRQLNVRVRPAVNTDSFSWFSTDTGIVVVDDKGVITTVAPGVADVVVESTGKGASSRCTVHSLALSTTEVSLEQYDSYYMDIFGVADNDRIIWRSSNPRVATVTANGQIIGRMSGTTTITASTHDKTLYCTVKVVTAKKYSY